MLSVAQVVSSVAGDLPGGDEPTNGQSSAPITAQADVDTTETTRCVVLF